MASNRSDHIALQGLYEVTANDILVDSYELRIEIWQAYPQSVPLVYEVGGRIPKTPNRHVNPTGNACLFVPDSRWRHWPIGARLVQFIEGPVYQYFLSQTYYELTGKWLFGERAHGDDGVLEFYMEELDLNDFGSVYKCLAMATKSKSRANAPCPCGSGDTLEFCHWPAIERIRLNIPRARITEVLSILKSKREK